jgi:hypothetical protein
MNDLFGTEFERAVSSAPRGGIVGETADFANWAVLDVRSTSYITSWTMNDTRRRLRAFTPC